MLAFEIGAGQEKLVQRLLRRHGEYTDVTQHRDENGAVRVFSARFA